MKNAFIIIVILIIAGALVALICRTRENAVEHYACTNATGQAAAAGLVIDFPNRTATVTGGPRAGSYRDVDVTADEVTWQKQGDFTFNRRQERLIILWNAQNIAYQSTAQCEPVSLYDRFVTLVH